MIGRPRSSALALLVACATVGCHRSTELSRADWASEREGDRLFVRTLDSTNYNLRKFAFTTQGLVAQSGQRVAPNGQRAAIGSSIRLPLDSISAVRVDKLDMRRTLLLTAAATTA